MLAARFDEPGRPLRIEELDRPTVGPDEVLVRIAGAGLCHSDLHVIDGELEVPTTPLTLGHENAGYVETVGEEVEGFDPGEPVAVYGLWGCGHCRVCVKGREHLCETPNWAGIGTDGGYAEYLLVPEARYLVPLGELDPVRAAPLTDAALTPYQAVKKARSSVPPGGTVVVIGIGGLGQFGVQFAAQLTGATVIAVDIDENALDRAKGIGADVTLTGAESDLVDAVDRETDGRGADAVLDFVGTDQTLADGAEMLQKQGMLMALGLAGGEVQFSHDLPRDTRFVNSTGGSIPDLWEVVDLARAGRLDIRIESVGFDELNDTFARLRSGDVPGRAVLTP